VETCDGETYRRTFSIGGAAGRLAIRVERSAPTPRGEAGALEVEVELAPRMPVEPRSSMASGEALDPTGPLATEIARRVRRLIALDVDPAAVAAHLSRDPRLRASVRARPGLRVPGAWDPFELAVRAVLGQQVSVAAARTLAGRLAAAHGVRLAGAGPAAAHGAGPAAADAHAAASAPGLPGLLFPSPAAIASADPATFGMPRVRAAALRALAAAVAEGQVALAPRATLEETVADLDRLPGVGPWTAHYIAMRAYADPDAFPAGDLGVRRALGTAGAPASEREAERRAERWRPFRAYAVMHLWTGA
jgi:AraC family transcriptional regulator of adaptative response / DNA-3-methyladenine glycosylase II